MITVNSAVRPGGIILSSSSTRSLLLDPEPLAVRHGTHNYAHWLIDMLPILWRRRRAIYVALVLTSGAAFFFYSTVGERYESYTLLRVGQGIKDRPTGGLLGEAQDLTSRIESLGRIASTDHVIRLAASELASAVCWRHSIGLSICSDAGIQTGTPTGGR